MIRLDAERAGLSPTAGAFVRARDAAELWQLTLQGLAGSDFLGDAAIAWRGLPPEITLFADGGLDRRELLDGTWDRRGWGVAGVDVAGRIRDDLTATLSGSAWSTWLDGDPVVQSVRATAEVDLGSGTSRSSPIGSAGSASVTRAWSTLGPWDRVEVDASGAAPLPWSLGPLSEQAMRLEWRLDGAATDREVHPDERVWVGGDVPAALQLDAPIGSLPFPGFPAWALGGSTLGLGYARAVAPVAVRLRAGAGPLYVQGIDLAGGGGLAAVPGEAPLGSASVEVRVAAILLDSPFDSLVRFAWGIGQPPDPLPHGFGAGLVRGPSAGPHLYVGLGTGF
jgi:hypothetical protein